VLALDKLNPRLILLFLLLGLPLLVLCGCYLIMAVEYDSWLLGGPCGRLLTPCCHRL
jgi:hypothetical protein